MTPTTTIRRRILRTGLAFAAGAYLGAAWAARTIDTIKGAR